MAGKLQEYRRIAETAQRQLTGSLDRWQSFLTTASRLYKYPYHEQVMIHAQRPDATACAEYDVWNNTMRRYVRRGTKGIALLDIRSDLNRLRYVFDISDTGARENSRSINLWQLRDEHLPAVSAMLETVYAIPANADFGAQLETVAAQLVREYWEENKRDILDTLANSFLEGYDEFNAGVAFRNAAQASVSYCLMSRCGLKPSDYLEREDFMSVFDFNTPDAAAALGTAVSGINQQVLREIGVAIRHYERERIAERSITHGDDLHESRGLSGSERQTEQSGNEASWEIRADAESASAETSPDSLESTDSEGSAVFAPAGDRRDGAQAAGRNAAADGGAGRRDRGIEAEGSAGMGGADEQPESAGGGDHSERTGVQLTESEEAEPAIIAEEPPKTLSALDDGWFPPGNEDSTPSVDEIAGQFEQLSLFGLFAAEEEQIARIDEAESMMMPSAFSTFISQNDIDHILRAGGNEEDARMRIIAEFSKQKSLESRAAFLKALYHGGSGLITGNGKISTWYGEDGIHIASGNAARYLRSAQVISWADAAKRTEELLDSGAFATNLEITEAPRNERLRIAAEVWNLYHDFSDEAKSLGYLSCLGNIRSNNYPEETERLMDALANPAFAERLLIEYRVFLDAYRGKRELMRFHYHRPQALLTRLEDLSLPRKEYRSDMTALPETGSFITEDEIADSLANGSGFEGGKTRIYEFFQTPHVPKESVDFLKKEYGVGGRTHAVSGENGSYEDHGSKGIVLKKSNCADIQMNWNNVASRISELIRLNRYFTPDEQALYDKRLIQDTARNAAFVSYNAVKETHPEDMVLFQVGDFFEMYDEDARQAESLLDLNLTTRNIPNVGRVTMCGIPAHSLEQSVEKLRDRYDVTIAATQEGSNERHIYTLRSIDHEAEAAIDAYEAKFGADGTKVFRDPAAEQPPQPTMQELFDEYKLTVGNALSKDAAFVNACRNSDRQNAYLEGADAIRRIAMASDDLQLVRLYFDMPAFHNRLHQELLDELYPTLATTVTPSPYRVTQEDIDEALQKWNGNLQSKQAVVRYMERHGREKGTALWLAREYGASDASKPFQVSVGSSDSVVLPWAKVQRRIAQLIKDDKFYTEAEHDDFDDIDPIAIREALAERGIVGGEVVDSEKLNSDPFIQRVMQTVTPPAAAAEPSYAVGDTVYLDNKPFEITEVGLFDVHLLDPSQVYPIFRAESKERLAALLRRDERNAHLFTPKSPAQEQPEFVTTPVAFYPAEKTNLPYDIEIQTFHVPAPEHDPPSAEPAVPESPAHSPAVSVPIDRNAQNFHITDDNLGVGGAKAKFRANMDAINLLKELEFGGRQATPEEQTVLAKYVGWGGLADAFDETKSSWSDEFQELYAVLSPEEYAAARASTLNAHYTSPTVIHAIYEVLDKMGFETGNILEPSMGIGNFFGCLPEKMQNSRLYGVELDSITGRIAKQLYPRADITVAGFETTDRRDFYDVAIGNVPFGQYQVNDRAYNKLGFSIHDYFFAKALDQIRPGGIIAFVTSRYTMDKQSPEVRKYIAQRAELLGAIRLPNNAFKANAGTGVVSDIIFLQRRDHPTEIEPGWVHLGQNEDGFAINSYFIEHPEMILGKPTSESTQYGRQDFTVAPIEGRELADQLHEAVQSIRGAYQAAELPNLGEDEALTDSIPAGPNVRNYSYTVVDGEVYYRQNSLMSKPVLSITAAERVKGMVKLRDCLHSLIDLQLDAMTSDEQIQQAQAELDGLYDAFSEKYGLINSRANALAFQDDSSYYLLCTLEELDEEKQLKRKADIFTKRTIKPHEVATSVDTPSEALALSISEKARVDLDYMRELTGMDEEALISGLQGVIFRDPVKDEWQTTDEYLSGNVRQKLREAEQAAKTDTAFLSNVEALRSVQPRDLEATEIEVRLSATWIDPQYIQQFMEETFEPAFYLRRNIRVHFSPFTAEWSISGKSAPSSSDVNAYMTYGTDRANAYRILEDTLNLRDVRIYDTREDPDGKERRILNSRETTLAQQKQQAIKDAFSKWIWKGPDRRRTLVARYNELFNSNRPREYDGSHIRFSGMNPEIHLREHQLNAVAHILYGGNTLLAHEVGAGKTFEMVAAAMESKRLGLCHKPMFVVPNHLTEQWAAEFLRLYPSASILAATKKDFEPKNRKKFCARIATGNYDAIIIGHSQFERIPVSMERQERMIREQIEEVAEGIEELKNGRAERFTIKSMERTKKGLEVRLKKLLESGRKDDIVTFEELGVDRLYVDEAHAFKNLFLYTKMRNVAGLSATDAQKSSDMLLKCRYIDELTGNKGVVFATGTPVSNSMTELYTMMRYLQHDTLQKKGLAHFDCWASTFGETTTAIELAPEGTGYRARTRFAKFFNLPELMALFKEVADIKTADQLHLPVPKAIYHNVVTQPTEIQQAMVQELSERAASVHAGHVEASVDNMLRITTDGRKLGLDQRIINPDLPDDPSSKVNQCVENIYRIWNEGQADKLTQLVFCDLSTPKTGASAAKAIAGNLNNPELHALETRIDIAPEPEFTVYDDIRNKLVAMGVPREQIAFIHEANTEVRKKELFAKVRTGQVRILMGSTFKMGAGMNVQDRLVALHDLDAPWRPGDLEQRSGRIIRQGNQNKEVHIYRYVTEATFDAYLWQTLENKQKFISQIMTSKSPVRACEDIDETALSYAEIKALCAGDDRIREKMDLDVDVARLKLMKANHQSQQYRLEDSILRRFPEQIEENMSYIAGLQADMATLAEHPHPAEGFAGMKVRGGADAPTLFSLQAAKPDHSAAPSAQASDSTELLYSDRENAGAALINAMKKVKGLEPVPVGSYRGFQMYMSLEDFGKQYILTLKGRMSHRVELGRDPRGNIIRIDNVLSGMENRLSYVQEKLDTLQAQMNAAKAELGKPFPQEQELAEKSARLAQLNIELNIDDRTPMEAIADTSEPAPDVCCAVTAKAARTSVLAKLHAPLPRRDDHPKQNEIEKEVR